MIREQISCIQNYPQLTELSSNTFVNMATSDQGDSYVSRMLFKWQRRILPPMRYVLLVALYLIAWVVLDKFSLNFAASPEVSIWYPPPALDLVLVLVGGWRYSLALWLNTLVHNHILGRDLNVVTVLISDLVTTVGYAGAGTLLLLKLKINPRLRCLRDVVWFIVVAVLVAPLVVAWLQFVNFAWSGIVPWSKWLYTLHYWAGNAIGISMLAPVLLILLRKLPWIWWHREQEPVAPIIMRWPTRLEFLEWLAESFALVLGLWIGYGVSRGADLEYTYLVFLPLMWSALRHGFERAAVTVLLLNVGVALLVYGQLGQSHVLTLQFGLMVISETGLILGAVTTNRRQADKELAKQLMNTMLITRLFNQVEQKAATERTLNQISRGLNSSLDPEKIFAEIVHYTGKCFSVDRVIIFALAAEQIVVLNEWRTNDRIVSILDLNAPLSEWKSIYDFDNSHICHVPDLTQLPLSSGTLAKIKQTHLVSALSVPIFICDQFFGGLSLQMTTTQRTFTNDDTDLLQGITEQAAIALCNAQSYERLKHLMKQCTQELEQEKLLTNAADLAKSNFLNNISHEMRTPLTGILGFSSVLLEQIYGPLNLKQKQYIEVISNSGKHLLALIDDLLDLTAIEAGEAELTKETISVKELASTSVSLIQELANARGLELSLLFGTGVNTCIADKHRLKQILMNLLSNAVKFTESGSVTLKVEQTADTIKFSVIDTGIGIALSEQANLFQLFWQLDSGLNRKYEGTGMGLALARKLAQLHGGEITVYSKPGQGSCFTLHLPASPAMGSKSLTLDTEQD